MCAVYLSVTSCIQFITWSLAIFALQNREVDISEIGHVSACVNFTSRITVSLLKLLFLNTFEMNRYAIENIDFSRF